MQGGKNCIGSVCFVELNVKFQFSSNFYNWSCIGKIIERFVQYLQSVLLQTTKDVQLGIIILI